MSPFPSRSALFAVLPALTLVAACSTGDDDVTPADASPGVSDAASDATSDAAADAGPVHETGTDAIPISISCYQQDLGFCAVIINPPFQGCSHGIEVPSCPSDGVVATCDFTYYGTTEGDRYYNWYDTMSLDMVKAQCQSMPDSSYTMY